MNDERIKYFQEGYRKDLIQSIARNINNRESFTLVGMPGVGISTVLQYIVHDDFISRFNVKKNTLIVLIDMNNLLEASIASFYRLVFKRLIEAIKLSNEVPDTIRMTIENRYKEVILTTDTFLLYEETKDTLKLLTDSNVSVVIILDEFVKLKEIGTLAFSNLKAIRDVDKDQISIVFVGNQNLLDLFDHDTLQGLHTLLRFKFVYVLRLNRKEADNIFDDYEKKLNYKIRKKDKDIIYNLTGGNIWLMKKIITLHNDNSELFHNGENLADKLMKIYDIQVTVDYFWNKLSKKDSSSALSLINEEDPDISNNYLFESGILVKNDDGSVRTFSPLLDNYIKNTLLEESNSNNPAVNEASKVFKIDNEDRVITKGHAVIGSELTKTEFDVLAYLIENSGKAVTRDEIGVVMWGDERFEKYSDYAIDRLISRIRSKIGENASAPKYLKTVKGVGFRFINS